MGPMTNPPSGFPSRPSVGRSSFAIAMKDYTFIRPGVAVTISAVTLALALMMGFWLIVSLREAAQTATRGATTVETLHRYSAGVDTVRAMQKGWASVRQVVDSQRHTEVGGFLDIQEREARWWRDAALTYFQQFSRKAIPAPYEQPAHPLAYYQRITCPSNPDKPRCAAIP